MSPISMLQAQARYGEISNGVWGDEGKWCVLWVVPKDLLPALKGWTNSATGLPVVHVYCNKDMAPCLERAIRKVVERGLAPQLKTFDGCHMIRSVRGQPKTMSAHAWAGAIDINAATNQLGTPGDITDELAACFREEGFFWGKYFKRQDPMHMTFLGW